MWQWKLDCVIWLTLHMKSASCSLRALIPAAPAGVGVIKLSFPGVFRRETRGAGLQPCMEPLLMRSRFWTQLSRLALLMILRSLWINSAAVGGAWRGDGAGFWTLLLVKPDKSLLSSSALVKRPDRVHRSVGRNFGNRCYRCCWENWKIILFHKPIKIDNWVFRTY